MTVTKKASSSDLIDQLLADYQKSEALLGEAQGLWCKLCHGLD
jgi:hypothetical protein